MARAETGGGEIVVAAPPPKPTFGKGLMSGMSFGLLVGGFGTHSFTGVIVGAVIGLMLGGWIEYKLRDWLRT